MALKPLRTSNYRIKHLLTGHYNKEHDNAMGKYKDGNVPAEQAAKELNMSADNLRQNMLQNAFQIPIGYVKKGEKHNAYYIKRPALDRLKKFYGID